MFHIPGLGLMFTSNEKAELTSDEVKACLTRTRVFLIEVICVAGQLGWTVRIIDAGVCARDIGHIGDMLYWG